MEAKFTKGEWCVDDYTNIDGTIRVMHGNIVITYFGHKTENNLANAHLIAAAPEMYDMLERDIKLIEARLRISDKRTLKVNPDVKTLERKKSLLAKARGE